MHWAGHRRSIEALHLYHAYWSFLYVERTSNLSRFACSVMSRHLLIFQAPAWLGRGGAARLLVLEMDFNQ